MKQIFALLLGILFLTGCTSSPAPETDQSVPSSAPSASISEPSQPPTDPRQEAVEALISNMSTEEKVGQLFFARCPAQNGAQLASEYHLGGYILFGRDFKDKTLQEVQEAIASYQDSGPIPMLIGVDEEGGTVVRVSSNPNLRSQRFLSPQQLYQQGGIDAILADTREKDALLHSLGINVNLAPVADLSTNPNDFMYDRTLGLGAQETSDYIAAVVSQMETDGMGSVLKHFPGYGSNGDTHTDSIVDSRALEQFRTEDFLPFQAGIEASQGSSAILFSHNIMQAVDPELPASLSPAVHQLLREELGFQGVALTDDLVMDALDSYSSQGSAAVLALLAGNDMLISTEFTTQIPQVLEALEQGTLTTDQIDWAAARVLGWKYDLGLLG